MHNARGRACTLLPQGSAHACSCSMLLTTQTCTAKRTSPSKTDPDRRNHSHAHHAVTLPRAGLWEAVTTTPSRCPPLQFCFPLPPSLSSSTYHITLPRNPRTGNRPRGGRDVKRGGVGAGGLRDHCRSPKRPAALAPLPTPSKCEGKASNNRRQLGRSTKPYAHTTRKTK